MKKREPISKIMTKDVITLNLAHSLEDAKRLFEEKKIRHAPVVKGEKVIGILSLTDLLRISFVDSYDGEDSVDTAIFGILNIEQVMISNPVTVAPDTTIKEVAEILYERDFHALPVVEDGNLKGIVTTTDLIHYLLDMY